MDAMHGLGVVVVAALVIAACAPTPPGPSGAPAASPTATPVVFEITPELSLEGRPYPLRDGDRVNGDETLVFRLGFHTAMDLDSVSAAIRRQLPEATGFRTVLPAADVSFEVPPGTGSLVIDPTGARSASGGGTTVATSWRITRPETLVALYDPAAVAAGATTPSSTMRFRIAPNGGDARFDPAMRTVLLSHTPANASFIDIASARRTPLPDRLASIYSNGSTYFGWLPDGRFLAVGSSETFIGDAVGRQLRALPALVGQSGVVSPSGRLLAVWSYAQGGAAIVDLEGGTSLSLSGEFPRCSVAGGVGLTWAPDSRTIAISSCATDMAGASRTRFFDAATGQLLRTAEGVSVSAWFADGRMLLTRWSATETDPRRSPGSPAEIVDVRGATIGRIAIRGAMGISPDGRWLLDTGEDPQHPQLRVVEIATGRPQRLPVTETSATWTPSGMIAVVASPTPR